MRPPSPAGEDSGGIKEAIERPSSPTFQYLCDVAVGGENTC
jgi:hypothetical protein